MSKNSQYLDIEEIAIKLKNDALIKIDMTEPVMEEKYKVFNQLHPNRWFVKHVKVYSNHVSKQLLPVTSLRDDRVESFLLNDDTVLVFNHNIMSIRLLKSDTSIFNNILLFKISNSPNYIGLADLSALLYMNYSVNKTVHSIGTPWAYESYNIDLHCLGNLVRFNLTSENIKLDIL